MKLTIIPDDNMCLVDGEARIISMTDISADIHSVQWFGDTGEIEYKDAGKPHNTIHSIDAFQVFIDRWQAVIPTPISPALPKSDIPLNAEELATQMIEDGTMTQTKINSIKAAR